MCFTFHKISEAVLWTVSITGNTMTEIIRKLQLLYISCVILLADQRAGTVNHTQAAMLNLWADFGSKPGFNYQTFRDICCTL